MIFLKGFSLPFIKKKVYVQEPTKLFLFLMRRYDITQKEAQKWIDTYRIYRHNRPILDKAATVFGELEILLFQPQPKGLFPIFQTPSFAIFDKPSGVMVHPRNRYSEYTMIDEVRSLFGPEANIAHRIDKETSGLLLVSKERRSEKILKGQFEKREIKKGYLALVKGKVGRELFIDAPIYLNRDFAKIKLKAIIDKRGKPAQTIIKPLRIIDNFTLVEAIPLTGRQHQIRAHLFHVKHPIVGDPIYGPSTAISIRYLDKKLPLAQRVASTGARRLMLHANWLDFTLHAIRYKIFSKEDFLQQCLKAIRSPHILAGDSL